MTILSLFDGMSCGRIALERAGIKVTKYYASEIDKYAEKISASNYPDIIRLGDITKWKEWDIETPDIILAGSPCQGFSFAGKGLNFNDPRSALFFTFADILKYYKPKYFLLENVKMKAEHQDVISGILGEIYPKCVNQAEMFRSGRLEPILINSALVSAQNRERLYWCNWKVTQPEDKKIFLKDIIENAEATQKKAFCLLTTYRNVCATESGIKRFKEKHLGTLVSTDNITWRKLTVTECERLQTVPDGYCKAVSNFRAYHALGNGWTVDVIAHILKQMEI